MAGKAHPKFQFSRAAENKYTVQLKKIAKHATALITTHLDKDGIDLDDVEEILQVSKLYSESLTPWAKKVSKQMIDSVAKSDANAWRSNSEQIGRLLKKMLSDDVIGGTVKSLQARNVELIKSIPIEAAQRVQKLALQAAVNGSRAAEIQTEIMRTGDVSAGRAKLIARTEVANANAVINQTRAQSVGITQYTWETMEDESVRPSHQAMQGNVYSYDDPPEVEGEGNHGPGQFPNCFPGLVEINHTPIIEKLYRRRYSGVLSTLVLDDGIILPSTPNHPILTPHGFKAANKINVGDYVIKTVQNTVSMINDNINRFNISFDQMFNALNDCRLSICTRSISGNFHGDIAHEEIDIISINSMLIRKRYLLIRQKMIEIGFTNTDTRLLQYILIGDRCHFEFIKASYPTYASFMSRIILIYSLLISHISPLDFFCFALGSNMGFSHYQIPSNDGSGNFKVFRDSIFAYAILIHGYDIIKVKLDFIMRNWPPKIYFNSGFPDMLTKNIRMDRIGSGNIFQSEAGIYKVCRVNKKLIGEFSGHVYNLQTKTGYYMANTVLSSNCRCYASPILPVGN
jgi:SPP1 gp7 family putative phage head morphogenesis protein